MFLNTRPPMLQSLNMAQIHITLSNGVLMTLSLIALFGTGLVFATISQGECPNHCSKCEDGFCKECYYGYWGYRCHRKCVDCWLGGCKKSSGHCVQCQPGYHGRYCNITCPANCRKSKFEDIAHCERHHAKCLEGCIEGWWGSTCQNECSYGCQEACYQKDGACISECRKGFYGTHCTRRCSIGCVSGTCDWLTGTCHGGCKCGYSGDTCEDVCSFNCYSPCKYDDEKECLQCDVSCGMTCKTCDKSTGRCRHCHHGFYGPECKQPCGDTCIGNKCNISGYCTEGCKEGYHGDKCKDRCPADCNPCSSRQGRCSYCSYGSKTSCETESLTDTDGDIITTIPYTENDAMIYGMKWPFLLTALAVHIALTLLRLRRKG